MIAPFKKLIMPLKESQIKMLCERAVTEKATVADWLHWLEQQFAAQQLYFGHGTDSAWDEAVHLLLQALQWPMDSGNEVLSRPLDLSQRQAVAELAYQRIVTRKPLPYLTHQAWFMGLPFYVDERVLIPRSPFAEWIAKQFSPWIMPEQVHNILEIGTGSGCMAIAAALAFPHAKVIAADIDAGALTVAALNIQQHGVEERVSLVRSDCYANLAPQKFDIIMSNPPYVGSAEMETLPEEYRHEPNLALQADENGLEIASRLLTGAAERLTEHGIFVLEVGNSDEALQQRYPHVPFIWLEQEFGGHGLCLLTRAMLLERDLKFL